MRSRLLVTLLCLYSVAARAESDPPPERITVDDAVRIALHSHPTLGTARAGQDAARARSRESFSSLLPALTASFSYVPQTSNFTTSPSLSKVIGTPSTVAVGVNCDPSNPACKPTTTCVVTAMSATVGDCFPTASASKSSSVTFDMSNFFSTGFGISWVLFDFGRNYFGWRANQANERAATAGYGASALQVVLDVRTAFYNLIAADALVDVAIESVTTQDHHLSQMKGFVTVGTRTRVDLAQAMSDYEAARLALARAKGTAVGARATLQAALGPEDWRPVVLVTPPPAAPAIVPSPDEALTEAIRNRPEARQVLEQIRAAENTKKSVRGNWFPSLTMAAGPSFAGTTTLTPNFQVSISLGYTGLGFNPVLVEAQNREARANIQAAVEQARAVRNAIRLETAQAVAAVNAAVEAIEAARALISAARERRDLANARFEAGLGTVLDLSDAELTYVNARAQEVQAEAELDTARARLEKALGH